MIASRVTSHEIIFTEYVYKNNNNIKCEYSFIVLEPQLHFKIQPYCLLSLFKEFSFY